MTARHACVCAAVAVLFGLPALPAQTSSPQGMVLVSYSGAQTVALIRAAGGELVALLPSGKGPHEITVSPDGALAYVAITGTGPGGEPGNTITVIDLKRRTAKREFVLTKCRQPHDTRLSRDGSLLWVACAPGQAVLELNARTGELLREMKTNLDGGWFVEATHDNHRLYVPHLEGKALSVIDLHTGAARAVYSGSTQFGIAISPNGRTVWVSDSDQHKLTIVDTSSDQLQGTVNLGAPQEGQSGFARLRFTPNGRSVAVVRGTSFIIIDARGRTIEWTLSLPHPGKVLAVSGDSRHAFVTHPDQDAFSVIDLTARKVIATYAVGQQPDGIAWIPFASRR